jgi:hypothetical protein
LGDRRRNDRHGSPAGSRQRGKSMRV